MNIFRGSALPHAQQKLQGGIDGVKEAEKGVPPGLSVTFTTGFKYSSITVVMQIICDCY